MGLSLKVWVYIFAGVFVGGTTTFIVLKDMDNLQVFYSGLEAVSFIWGFAMAINQYIDEQKSTENREKSELAVKLRNRQLATWKVVHQILIQSDMDLAFKFLSLEVADYKGLDPEPEDVATFEYELRKEKDGYIQLHWTEIGFALVCAGSSEWQEFYSDEDDVPNYFINIRTAIEQSISHLLVLQDSIHFGDIDVSSAIPIRRWLNLLRGHGERCSIYIPLLEALWFRITALGIKPQVEQLLVDALGFDTMSPYASLNDEFHNLLSQMPSRLAHQELQHRIIRKLIICYKRYRDSLENVKSQSINSMRQRDRSMLNVSKENTNGEGSLPL